MKLNARRTAFELIPDRVEIVKEILELAKNGMGQAQIAKRLNERAVMPFTNIKGWYSSYIYKILTNTALYGEFQPGVFEDGKTVPHGEPVPDYYPALITKDEFFLIQSQRSQRAFGGAKAKKGSSMPNLLSGIVKCGYCGSTMVLAGATAKRIRADDGTDAKRPAVKVLVCDGARRGLGCYAVQWNYQDFEKSFLMFCRGLDLARILTSVDHAAATAQRRITVKERVDVTNAEIDQATKRMSNLLNVAGRENPPDALLEWIRDTETELTRLKEQKKKLETELVASEEAERQLESAGEFIRELIAKMESLSGDALFKVRVALADHIRRHLEVIQVFPAGRLHSTTAIQQIRDGLAEMGLSQDQIDEHIRERYRTEPLRQGRGKRGRYASRKDIARLFLIQAKNGGYTTVYPDFEDPTDLKFGTEVLSGGGYRRIHSESDVATFLAIDAEINAA